MASHPRAAAPLGLAAAHQEQIHQILRRMSGRRLNLDEAEDAWQLLRAAVAQREAEEGMEESDSVS